MGDKKGNKEKRLRKKAKGHTMPRNCTFQAVPNSAQPALKDKYHKSQSFFSIYFLFISMLTLMVLS